MRLGRADRSVMSEWWWTIDRWLLFAVLLLVAGGLVLSLAASPPVAQRIGLEAFHFVKRHALFLVPAFGVFIAASLMDARLIRRAALAVFVIALALMVVAILFSAPVKGSTRWIWIGSFAIQPSEFAKPAFVVLAAWLFAESAREKSVPGNILAVVLYALFAGLLVLQPDFGQTLLVTLVWGALFFIAGMPLIWIVLMAGLSIAGMFAAYSTMPHVAGRIDRFLDPGSGDTYQMDQALQSFLRGGWFGRGPGEGTVKNVLPDSHTDFIFAVVAEEFGIVVCLALVALFAFVVLRGLRHALHEQDAFARLAVTGLVILFGVQALINMAVNLALLPAKGMTLPFISYGGSSLISMAFTMGMVLALTRRRPKSQAHSAHLAAGIAERRAS